MIEPESRAATALDLVVLAGGAAKRMMNGHPKALHPVFFRPMIHYALDAAASLPHRSLTAVVGRGERELREQCRHYSDLAFVRQEANLGPADAVRALESSLNGREGDVLILAADAVLLTASSLRELLAEHIETGADCTFGRPGAEGGESVVWCFRLPALFDALKRAGPAGPDKEFRLSDTVAALAAHGGKAVEYVFGDPAEALEVNDFHDLWRVESLLQERFNRDLMLRGVALQDPRSTVIDPRCRFGPDVRIEGGCTIINSSIEAGVVVESHCRILASEIGPGSKLRQGCCVEQSKLGRDCRVGPYAHLRPETRLDDGVWIGNYVEIRNATLGAGTRAAHLSYIGDAVVGRNVVIGCGFITCGSGGRPLAQRTVIEDDVFIGSAVQAIAPVTLGAGSFIATGTSVTEDVPPGSFVISRGRQVTKPGYAKKHGRPKGPFAAR